MAVVSGCLLSSLPPTGSVQQVYSKAGSTAQHLSPGETYEINTIATGFQEIFCKV